MFLTLKECALSNTYLSDHAVFISYLILVPYFLILRILSFCFSFCLFWQIITDTESEIWLSEFLKLQKSGKLLISFPHKGKKRVSTVVYEVMQYFYSVQFMNIVTART